MPSGTGDKATIQPPSGGGLPTGAAAAGTGGGETPPAAGGGATALAVRESDADGAWPDFPEGDEPLGRLPMQVHVMAKVRAFRVQDLLAMQKGTVLETVHEHTQDMPVRCGGVLLLWSEFEVLDQRLAVRVTRLA